MDRWFALIPALLSLPLPGFGQAYNGQTRKAGLIVLTLGLVGVPLFPFLLLLPGASAAVFMLLLRIVTYCALIFFAVDAWKGRRVSSDPLRMRLRRCGTHFLLLLLVLTCIKAQRRFGVDAYSIPSESMSPTLLVGEDILALKWITEGEFHRGDIVLSSESEAVFVRRIVGLPGDRIEFRDQVFVLNGMEMAREPSSDCGMPLRAKEHCFKETMNNRSYHTVLLDLTPDERKSRQGMRMSQPYTVPAGHVFLVGDYRDNSFDSRFKGPAPIPTIIGKPLKIYNSRYAGRTRWERLGRRTE